MDSIFTRRQKRHGCDWCGAIPTKIMEMTVSHVPPPGSGKNRGKYVGSTTKRACGLHAEEIFGEFLDPKPRPRHTP